MKKSSNGGRGFVLGTIVLLLLASCQGPLALPGPSGSLSLSAEGSDVRSILPGTMAVSSYRASGSGPSGAVAAEQTSSTGSFTFSNLVPGSWTFTVSGLVGGAVLVSGSVTVTVSAGANQNANVLLRPASGNGTLSLAVSWPAGKPVTSIVGTLTPDGSSNPTTLGFTVSGTSASYSGTLASGSYTLTVAAKNGSVTASSTLESVVIYPGQTSSWTATLVDNQFASSGKEIGLFSLTLPDGTKRLGSISGTAISVVVPWGTAVTSLVPTLRTTGASVSPALGVAQNFTDPIVYTVTADDGSTKDYTVTVTVLGAAGVSVTDPPSVTVSLSAPATINFGSTITATPSTSVDSYAWYLDDALQVGQTGSSLTIGTSLALGAHGVMVAVKKSGVVFSQSLYFSVASPLLLGGSSQGNPLTLSTAVTTVAGSLTGASGSDNGIGTSARFYHPFALTSDGTNLYVTDTGNHRIRKIVIATGDVSTLAGGGVGTATNGFGTSASFSSPSGITSDGTNLYVSDTGNNLIRKIVQSTGEVTTFAGGGGGVATNGIGTAASFGTPYGITTDGTNLYVAEAGNHLIRKIVISTRDVSTLAGSTSQNAIINGTGTAAGFGVPVLLTTDGSNLFVAEAAHNLIRKIEIATGVVTTFAGSGISGFLNGTGTNAQFRRPNGIATDGTHLYVADNDNQAVRKIVIATREVTTLAGGTSGLLDATGTSAQFREPNALTVVGGALYIAEYSNNTIRRIQ